ncbi:MAG: hypothetical protein AMJ81_10895, partial [Phycisphaerae bacterium SM23_33]
MEHLEPRLLLDAGAGTALLGDANGDGVVDGLDYNVWSLHYDQPGDWGDGDFTQNGFVDGLDYNVWSLHYKALLFDAQIEVQ